MIIEALKHMGMRLVIRFLKPALLSGTQPPVRLESRHLGKCCIGQDKSFDIIVDGYAMDTEHYLIGYPVGQPGRD
jgi:hypothetical protein